MPKERPVHELRLGRVKATVRLNRSPKGTWHSVAISRLYKEASKWQETTSFHHDDLPLVAEVASQAWLWCLAHGQEERDAVKSPAKAAA